MTIVNRDALPITLSAKNLGVIGPVVPCGQTNFP